jgi:hypothetical protein
VLPKPVYRHSLVPSEAASAAEHHVPRARYLMLSLRAA